jgi:hypothetical protein
MWVRRTCVLFFCVLVSFFFEGARLVVTIFVDDVYSQGCISGNHSTWLWNLLLPFIFVWTKLPDECFLKNGIGTPTKKLRLLFVLVVVCTHTHTRVQPVQQPLVYLLCGVKTTKHRTSDAYFCAPVAIVYVSDVGSIVFSFFHEYSPRL